MAAAEPGMRRAPAACADVVVIGAGPYGLSAAAHLLGRGLRVAVFGRTAESWCRHMPRNMRLRSHWWAMSLSDPHGRYGIERFFREAGRPRDYPVPKDTFVEYVRWFQQHAVPELDESDVDAIERRGGGFALTLADGRAVHAPAVVVATGLSHYAHRPEGFDHLPAGYVSHTFDHADLGAFAGRRVLIVGGGQSALESAALLAEEGARVDVIARRPIVWDGRDRSDERTRLERIRAPRASIAPGWANWMLDHLPYAFHGFPQDMKDAYLRNCAGPAAAHWLRACVGRVTLREREDISTLRCVRDGLAVTLAGGARLTADHLMLATGYHVDLDRLPLLRPALRAAIATDRGTPRLTREFESSVPGLFFIGLASVRAFGPLYRFVAGCDAAARRVAAVIEARTRRLRSPHWVALHAPVLSLPTRSA